MRKSRILKTILLTFNCVAMAWLALGYPVLAKSDQRLVQWAIAGIRESRALDEDALAKFCASTRWTDPKSPMDYLEDRAFFSAKLMMQMILPLIGYLMVNTLIVGYFLREG